MNSITRRLNASFAGQRAGRIIFSTLLLFVLCCAGFLAAFEYRALGFLKWNVTRSFFAERTLSGKLTELYYRVMNAGSDPVDIAVGRTFTVICIVFAAILVFRFLWLALISAPRHSRKVRQILRVSGGIRKLHLVKQSVDARKKNDLHLVPPVAAEDPAKRFYPG